MSALFVISPKQNNSTERFQQRKYYININLSNAIGETFPFEFSDLRRLLRNSVLAFVKFCAKHLCATIAAISWVVARN
ncbi:hypothetical protein V6N13_102656 [Hibiscus sabdariffa]|uniref:Uncharacterized protein n=1 Tax=Hibiscus sabdariffa TaxID=183260 RepID=A0ABR2D4S4_9ROSI